MLMHDYTDPNPYPAPVLRLQCCGVEPSAWMKSQKKSERLDIMRRTQLAFAARADAARKAKYDKQAADVKARLERQSAVQPLLCTTTDETIRSEKTKDKAGQWKTGLNKIETLNDVEQTYGIKTIPDHTSNATMQVTGGGFVSNKLDEIRRVAAKKLRIKELKQKNPNSLLIAVAEKVISRLRLAPSSQPTDPKPSPSPWETLSP
jgi:hypothetical protein